MCPQSINLESNVERAMEKAWKAASTAGAGHRRGGRRGRSSGGGEGRGREGVRAAGRREEPGLELPLSRPKFTSWLPLDSPLPGQTPPTSTDRRPLRRKPSHKERRRPLHNARLIPHLWGSSPGCTRPAPPCQTEAPRARWGRRPPPAAAAGNIAAGGSGAGRSGAGRAELRSAGGERAAAI